MRDYGLDGGDSVVSTPDLQLNTASATTSASITSKDSYSITIENLPVKLTGKYNFVFQYLYENPDKTQSTPILGPTSATYSVAPTIADLSTAPTNVVATGGFYSYQLKWDTPTFLSYGDTIVYENSSNSFNSSSKVVYVGTSNQCTILTSDLVPKYVYVVHRDMFLDANKKGTVVGPITIQDPITVDANPPTNTFTVGTTTVQDDPDGLFTFNKKILFTWTENTDATTYGYQIRFRRLGTTDYTYMSAPGKATVSTYLYGVKAGQTYEIGITTYDQFGNINTADWKSYPNIVIAASTSLQADVAITAGDMKLGYGIGGDNANKGLYLGPENYWYVQGNTTAASAARLSVGGTSDRMLWDGTSLAITGNLTARAGTFTGNILMATSNASIYNGTINSSGNLTGNGFALNSTGLKVANGTNSVTIAAATGAITANAGTIGGWSLTDSLLNQNGARLSSSGYIELGAANTDNIIRLDANHADFRLWIGRNSATTAPFRVTKEGVLYATGAVLTNLSIATTISDGTSLTTIKDNAATGATALQPGGTLTGNVTGTVNGVAVATVTSGAALGAAAIQAGNGIGIDSTSKYINTIDLNSSGIIIKTAASGTRMQLTNAGLELFNGTTRTVFIDAATGTAKFAGDISGSTGTFTGGLKTGTSGARIEVPASNGTVNFYTSDATMTDPGNINTLSVTINGQNLNWLRLNSPTKSGNGLANISLSSDTLNRSYIYSSATEWTHLGGTFKVPDGITTLYALNTSFIDMSGASKYIQLSTGGTLRSLFSTNGTIYANYLNTTTDGQGSSTGGTTGTTIVQNSSGYLKVSGSSRRFKEDISPISKNGYLSALLKIEPVTFRYINPDFEEPLISGLIAEDLDLIPEFRGVINYDKDELPVSISYDRMSALIVLAIKELNDKLNAIANRLDALEA